MNPADAQVEVRDVFGRIIRGCMIDLVEKRAQGGKHYRAEVTAPGYLRDGVNLDFNGHGELVLLMDPQRYDCPPQKVASLELMRSRLKNAWVAGEPLWSMVTKEGGMFWLAPDRAWFMCDERMMSQVCRSRAFNPAPGGMHKPPNDHQWKQMGSFKSREPYCSLQLVFWTDGESWFVEVDVDRNNKMFLHAWDALIRHPVTGEPDSRLLAQLSVLYTGIPMGFEMRRRERAA